MRLSEFIIANIEPILVEWESFARSLPPGATMTIRELRNDAESILRATAQDMQNSQSLQEQASKSQGHGGSLTHESERIDHYSSRHGVGRIGSGFHITEVVSEYRALRASVLRLWRASRPQPNDADSGDIIRFDESLDQSLAVAVSSYSQRVEESRQMFLAILGHDMRNPLNCIRMAAQIIPRSNDDPITAEAVSMIESSTETIIRLISDLIDFSSSRLGRAMPLNREPVDLEQLCPAVIDAFRTTHPGRTLRFHSAGDVTGVWDAARIRQVVSNLLGNALQHGSPEGPIELSVAQEGSNVVLRVHNEGAPIAPEALPTIFDPLKRHAASDSAAERTPGSIGLGLYIVREIVSAKGGTIEIDSTAQEGTTFTVRIPRKLPAQADKQHEAPAD